MSSSAHGRGLVLETALMGLPDEENQAPASLVDALLVYAEPLADNAHAVVIGRKSAAVFSMTRVSTRWPST